MKIDIYRAEAGEVALEKLSRHHCRWRPQLDMETTLAAKIISRNARLDDEMGGAKHM